jgi:hypothetical protein
MPRLSGRVAAIGLIVASWVTAAGAAAIPRTFVSSSGSDSAIHCTAGNPCATLQAAINDVYPYGEVVILNSGDYGNATITKPLTLRNDKEPVSVTASITVTVASSDAVIVRGIAFNGVGEVQAQDGSLHPVSYATGLRVTSAGDVVVEHCSFARYTVAGVQLSPATGSLRVTVDDSVLVQNAIGLTVQGDSGVAGHLKLINSRLIANPTAGVQVVGTGSDALLSGNQVLGSVKALDLQAGATAKSYGNNTLSNGDAPTTVPLS